MCWGGQVATGLWELARTMSWGCINPAEYATMRSSATETPFAIWSATNCSFQEIWLPMWVLSYAKIWINQFFSLTNIRPSFSLKQKAICIRVPIIPSRILVLCFKLVSQSCFFKSITNAVSASGVIKANYLARCLNYKRTRVSKVGTGIIHSFQWQNKYVSWEKSNSDKRDLRSSQDDNSIAPSRERIKQLLAKYLRH